MKPHYSQFLEEPAILEACAGIEVGRLLDIGAWHHETFSNSRALILSGWRGILVEPSPGPMHNLIKEYGNSESITLIQAAVGLVPSLCRLHVTDDAVTTSNETEFEKWKDTAKFDGLVTVPAITLEQIGNQFGGFDFINFDAEGLSAELFLQMLDLGWEPRCCCVEHDNRLVELCAKASTKYNLTYSNGTNAVFARKIT